MRRSGIRDMKSNTGSSDLPSLGFSGRLWSFRAPKMCRRVLQLPSKREKVTRSLRLAGLKRDTRTMRVSREWLFRGKVSWNKIEVCNVKNEKREKEKEKEDRAAAAAPEEEILPRRERIKREVIAWMWVILIFLLINGTVGQARVIPSGSMENTLLVGDHLIMSRIGYDAGVPFTNWHVPLWRNPKRQQIVIFIPPAAPNETDLIKRVIGLPGETLDIRAGAVWINGKQLAENYTTGPTELAPVGYSDLKFPYVIPDNCYFVMGDNRGNSMDSRFWGCMPRKNLIGTPVMIYMSLNAPQGSWDPGEIGARFSAYANAVIHPGTVRWKRLFHTF